MKDSMVDKMLERVAKEVWKDIVGYEGIYKVSDLGRFRLEDRVDEDGRQREGRVLTLQYDKKGAEKVALKGKLFRTRRLVAEAFLDKPEGASLVRHKDGLIYDNEAKNLEWVV